MRVRTFMERAAETTCAIIDAHVNGPISRGPVVRLFSLRKDDRMPGNSFVINNSSDNQYYFYYRASNNEIVVTSETYKRKQSALDSITDPARSYKCLDN